MVAGVKGQEGRAGISYALGTLGLVVEDVGGTGQSVGFWPKSSGFGPGYEPRADQMRLSVWGRKQRGTAPVRLIQPALMY